MKNNQIKLGAILSYISIFLGNIVGIIYTPIMLSMLGQQEYGIYSLVGAIVSYITIIDLGIGNATIKYLSKYRTLNDKEKECNLIGMFILINIIIGIIAFSIGIILFNNLDSFFSNSLTIQELKKIKIMVLILAFNLAISFPFGVFGAVIISYEKFVFPKIVGIIRTFLNPIIILVILSMGYKSVGMVIMNTIINILFIWINMYYCFKVLKIKIYFKNFDFNLLKEILNYSFFIFIGVIVDRIYWNTDQFILGIFSGTTAIAIYSIASQLNMYYMQFSTSISGMFLPKVTSMVVREATDEELTNIFIKVGRIQYMILGLILSGFTLFGKNFINVWAGKEYINSYYIALILIIPFTIPLIQNIGISILQAKNMHKFRSITYFFIALINLIITIPLCKVWGGIGCAIGTAIAMVIGNIIIINIYYYKKVNLDIYKFWSEIIKITFPIIISLLFGFALNILINDSSIILFIIKGMLYSLGYIMLIYLLAMNKYEKTMLHSILLKINIKKFRFINKIYG